MTGTYIAAWIAICLVCDDIALGHIHPVKGITVLAALMWIVVSTVRKFRKRCK